VDAVDALPAADTPDETLRDAFSLVPEYLRTVGGAGEGATTTSTRRSSTAVPRAEAVDPARWFGWTGLAPPDPSPPPISPAVRLLDRRDTDWERLAPVPFSTVCFVMCRRPGRHAEALDAHNAAVMDAVNRSGECSSATRSCAAGFTIRLAVGNLRTESITSNAQAAACGRLPGRSNQR